MISKLGSTRSRTSSQWEVSNVPELEDDDAELLEEEEDLEDEEDLEEDLEEEEDLEVEDTEDTEEE